MLTGHTRQYLCIHAYIIVYTHILIVYNKINQFININKVLL